MKRSGHVLLVLMGVTATTSIGHYLAPPKNECAQQAPAAKPGTPPQQATQQPCKNTSSTRTGSRRWWGGSSGSDSGGSTTSDHTKMASASSSGPQASRGGFGSMGHGLFSGS
jgi:hypothetical protein